jgi:NAD(P)-dependent dehydrogenase (short-subunit alcohol dehydrogenase family)
VSDRLAGKVVVVTGAASGLGEAACRLFVDEGAHVVLADVQAERGEQIGRELGDRAAFVQCDVLDEEQIAAAIARAIDWKGHLDVSYHSAGAIGHKGTVDTATVEGWDFTQSLLLRSSMLVIKHSSEAMRRGNGGSIILTSSTAATSLGGTGHYAYSVAKRAIIGMGEYAAVKLAQDRIRVNTIVPGSIPSPIWGGLLDSSGGQTLALDLERFASMQPIPRAGRAADVAAAALFLASDESSFITGVTLPVDGGQTLYRPVGGTGEQAIQATSFDAAPGSS